MRGNRSNFLSFAFGLALAYKLVVGLSVVFVSHRAFHDNGHLVVVIVSRAGT
jgi:hypothetical protein